MKANPLSEGQIFSELKKIVGTLMKLDPAEVDNRAKSHSSKLKDDLGIDSVESLDFLLAIEDFYSITIDDEEAASLETVADVIALVERKKNG